MDCYGLKVLSREKDTLKFFLILPVQRNQGGLEGMQQMIFCFQATDREQTGLQVRWIFLFFSRKSVIATKYRNDVTKQDYHTGVISADFRTTIQPLICSRITDICRNAALEKDLGRAGKLRVG